MRNRLSIIGAGPGNVDLLTGDVRERVLSCKKVFALSRLASSFKTLRNDITVLTLEGLLSTDFTEGDACVLVSGDTGFFSAACKLANAFSEITTVEVMPGISSLQYFCSKTGVAYDNIKFISLHGRQTSILGPVTYNERLFVLTGGRRKAHSICCELAEAGLGSLEAVAGENLSLPTERIVKGTVSSLATENFSDLTVLYILNPKFIAKCRNYSDSDFLRGGAPMTKEEARWIISAKMNVWPDDIVWDIGAGTGSVSIELGAKAFEGLVYAIEQDSQSISLIKNNIKKLGSYNVIPVEGAAPESLKNLPSPDKVFIGGSCGNLKCILECIYCKNLQAEITITAITLETLGEALALLREPEVVCVNASRGEKVGNYNMMKANNPVYIITGCLYVR